MAKRAVKAARNMDAAVPVSAGNLQASPTALRTTNNRIFACFRSPTPCSVRQSSLA